MLDPKQLEQYRLKVIEALAIYRNIVFTEFEIVYVDYFYMIKGKNLPILCIEDYLIECQTPDHVASRIQILLLKKPE